MATGFVWNERYMWHETPSAAGFVPSRGVLPPGEYFENPETKRRMKQLMDGYGITERLVPIAPFEAGDEILQRFHTPGYLGRVRALSDAMGGIPDGEWHGLQLHQEAAIDAVVKGPLALLESRA